MIVYVAVLFYGDGASGVAGVAAKAHDAAALASGESGKALTLGSKHHPGELCDENGDLVGYVLKAEVGGQTGHLT